MDQDRFRNAIARLTPDQRSLLEKRLRIGRVGHTPGTRIPLRPDRSVHPLSPGQERLWALSRLRPRDPVYNIDAVWRLLGPLDVSALEGALRTIVDRHEPLRSRFAAGPDGPVQTVMPASSFVVEVIDAPSRGWDDEVVSNRIDATVSKPFDLSEGAPFRATVMRLQNEDHVLIVVAHHIVCDGWSMGILAEELGPAYTAIRDDVDVVLPEIPVSYADVAYWQSTNDTGRVDLEYWASLLTDDTEALRLPRHRGRRNGGMEGASVTFDIEEASMERVARLAREKRITPFALLLAAYQATLNRLTGQQSIVLCTPVAGRTHVETERLIGYFNNLVPLMGDVSGDPTLSQMMGRAAAAVAGAFDHSSAPFQDVAGLPTVATTPLTRGLFVLQDGEAPSPNLPDVVAEPIGHRTAGSDFELAVFLRPRHGGVRGVVVYRPALLADDQVRSVMDHFLGVLEIFVQEPDSRLSELPYFGVADPEPDEEDAEAWMASPTSLVAARLLQVWERVFRRPIGLDEDFFDLGGHSLLAAQLIADVEAVFGLDELPLSIVFEAPTVSQFARLIEDDARDQRWESLVPIKPSGDRPPLFFVHAHGGNVIGYWDLARHLSPRQPLYGLQAPRSTDEGHPRRIEHMAKSYIDEIRTVQPEGPYLIGGWCLGGDVAFEMGQQLRRAGAEVALVLMVDNPRPEHLETSARAGLRRHLDRLLTRLEMEWSNFVEVPRGERREFTVQRSSRLVRGLLTAAERWVSKGDGRLSFGIPHSRAFRQTQVAALHEKAYENYTPEPYDGAVAIFRAERQPRVRAVDPTLGWSPYVRGHLVDHALPGHRIGMLSEPRVAHSACILEGAIVAALSGGGDAE